MESIGGVPDAQQARDALADIERAQRAVRDTPWPTWIYPVNAFALGALALTSLAQDDRSTAVLAVCLAMIGANVVAGYRTGAPWTIPTSRVFLAGVAVSCVLVVTAFAATAAGSGGGGVVVPLAAGATAAYLAAGVVHRRSTGRPR